MPLRMLLYISQIYDKIIETKRVYSESLIELPTPEFYVFYNGKKDYPLHQELRLSKAFKIQGEETNLELVVHVININYEKEAELLKSCKTLQEYSFFIYQIRSPQEQGLERDEAVKKAIRICKEQGVLRDFLETHEQEVFGMLFRELTEEEAREVYFRDGLEQGIRGMILDNLEEGVPETRICEKLCRRFDLSQEEAKEYFDRYAKEEV